MYNTQFKVKYNDIEAFDSNSKMLLYLRARTYALASGIEVKNILHKNIFKINVDGVFFVARAVGRRMIVRNRGKIVNIGSVQSELGRPTIVPYTATKGAVKMMTKGLCAEWAKHGIQVNAIAPGYFVTELNKALVENKDFSDWLCKRTPAGRPPPASLRAPRREPYPSCQTCLRLTFSTRHQTRRLREHECAEPGFQRYKLVE